MRIMAKNFRDRIMPESLRLLAAFISSLLISLPLSAEPMHISVSVPGPGAASYLPVELIPKIGADRAEGAEVRVEFSPGGGNSMSELLTNNADSRFVASRCHVGPPQDPRVIALQRSTISPYVFAGAPGLKGK